MGTRWGQRKTQRDENKVKKRTRLYYRRQGTDPRQLKKLRKIEARANMHRNPELVANIEVMLERLRQVLVFYAIKGQEFRTTLELAALTER